MYREELATYGSRCREQSRYRLFSTAQVCHLVLVKDRSRFAGRRRNRSRCLGRFGGIAFKKDPSGRPWINTACEGEGASIWWPNKDQWRDEPESMQISIQIPDKLVDVSNGKFMGKTDLGDGYTRWDWLVQYPINNYDVSINIGKYEHWSDQLGDLALDFYALPEDLDKAKKQFAQARGMLEAYQHYFGDYPFKKDGYKLIEAPYAGMEHQSAVTYGNRFANGYLERDWTGVGISTRFDFIIIHESAHEWFGNAVTAADESDMWIHEGWATYLECLYVEFTYGHDDYLKYTNAYKTKVRNTQPIITPHGIHRSPPQDQYFKGALFLHTLRSVVDDDVTSAWLQCCKDSLVDFCKVGRGEERIVKVMIIQRNPDQVQRLWRREVVDWPGDDGNVLKLWIWRRSVRRQLLLEESCEFRRNEGIDVTLRTNRARQYAGEITLTRNEVCNLLAVFDANEHQNFCGFAIGVSLPILIRAILSRDRICNTGWNRRLCRSRGASENGQSRDDWKQRSHFSSLVESIRRCELHFKPPFAAAFPVNWSETVTF